MSSHILIPFSSKQKKKKKKKMQAQLLIGFLLKVEPMLITEDIIKIGVHLSS